MSSSPPYNPNEPDEEHKYADSEASMIMEASIEDHEYDADTETISSIDDEPVWDNTGAETRAVCPCGCQISLFTLENVNAFDNMDLALPFLNSVPHELRVEFFSDLQ